MGRVTPLWILIYPCCLIISFVVLAITCDLVWNKGGRERILKSSSFLLSSAMYPEEELIVEDHWLDKLHTNVAMCTKDYKELDHKCRQSAPHPNFVA